MNEQDSVRAQCQRRVVGEGVDIHELHPVQENKNNMSHSESFNDPISPLNSLLNTQVSQIQYQSINTAATRLLYFLLCYASLPQLVLYLLSARVYT